MKSTMHNRAKLGCLALAAIVAASAPVWAEGDGPTTRPMQHMGADHPDHPGRRPLAPLSEDHWNDVEEFMEQYSPRRMAQLKNLPDTRRTAYLKQLIADRYDYINGLKNDDPDLYKIQITKIQTEDAIYGALLDAKRDAKGNLTNDERKEIRDLVTTLVDANLDERAHRIEKIKESLATLQKSLENDKKNEDAMVDERFNQYLKEGPKPFKMERPPNPPPAPSEDQSDAGWSTESILAMAR